MKRPLAIFTLSFCFGILVASQIKVNFIFIYSLCVIFFVLSFLSIGRKAFFKPFILSLTFTLGIALLINSQSLPKSHLSKYIFYQNKSPYFLKGYVDSQPQFKDGRMTFIFKVEQIQIGNLRRSCCGKVLAHLKGKQNLFYGEELILAGNVYKPFNKEGSSHTNYRDYLYKKGIFFVLNVSSDAGIIRLNKQRGLVIKRLALWLKSRIEDIIFKRTSKLAAAILDAMILGEKKDIPEVIYNSMIKSGTVHILVVSGFNVGIISFIILLCLKLIRVPRKLHFIFASSLLIIYCLATGASTPVIRATVMAIVFMLSFLVQREADIYNSCAVAAIFILIANPYQLFDVGFQLSFASVISIVWLYPKLKSLLRIESLKLRLLKFLLEGCLVSFSAWLGTLGFVAYYFKVFSPVTVLANIFIVPLSALITLSGFSLIIIALILPLLTPFFASSVELLVTLLLKLNSLLISLPGAYFYL